MKHPDRIERRIKLHDLRVLLSVVEGGSMSKAAEALATSQPAVSRVIAELEESLGVRLLDRGPQGVVPTPYGRALIKRSVTVFDELQLGVQDLEFLADPTAGEVRVAAPMAQATGFVAATIDRLARRYPRVVCHLWIDDGSGRFGNLEEREVDLAIAQLFGPFDEGRFDAEILFTDRLIVGAATSNPLSRRRNLRLGDLMNEPWVLPPLETPIGQACAEAFRSAGLDVPAATVVCAAGLARAALVGKGRFLTITSLSVLRFAGREIAIKLLPVNLQRPPRPVAIITLKNRTLTPVAQLFIDCAREVAQPLAKGELFSRT